MTERASIFHVTQIGVETTPGTAVAANKLLQAIGIMVKPSPDIQEFRPAGQKFVTTTAMNREWTEGKASGAISYEEIIYPFGSLLATPVTTGPVNTVEYTHVFKMLRASPDAGKTYTMEQGGGPRAHKFSNGIFTDLTLKFGRGGVDLDGSVMGKALTDNIYMSTSELVTMTPTGTWSAGTFTLSYGGQTTTALVYNATAAVIQAALEALSTIGSGNVVVAGGPISTTAVTVQFTGALGAQDATVITANVASVTGTTPALGIVVTTPGAAPTTLALQPVAATHVTIETHPSGAFAAATLLDRVISAEWSVTGRFQPLYVLNGETSFVATVESVPTVSLKLLVEADSQGMGLLSDMRAGTTKFIRINCTGGVPTGGAVNPYILYLDTAARVTQIGEFTDSDGVYALEYSFVGIFDTDLTSATKATVRNTQVSL